MKKLLLISAATLIVSTSTFAGDYLTNTNQHAAFLRMAARGASIDVDGVYSNPAGLAFLPKNGFHLSLTGQSAYQTREIAATSGLWTLDGQETTQNYKGTASAPFIPSFHGVYKEDKWAISASFAVTGGGGKASFDNGLPMFNALAIGMLYQQQITPDKYTINTAMDGKQYIYGVQLGLSYRINDWLGVFAGGRMNYVKSGYEGYLTATFKKDIPQMGGMDIAKTDPETLLSLFSIVFQDVILFDNTILENIRIGSKEATDEQVIAAARLANVDEFAEKLPDGWNTNIGENGCELSGGERQRISIARAFLKNAPIILLDEATASLDVENETMIQTALSRLIADKTVLVIAHRMRTVAGADKIVVLSEGIVAEEGAPEELKKKNGLYAHMVKVQTESQNWRLV